MRFKTVFLNLVIFLPVSFLFSCGTGGSADSGASVVLEASITSDYSQIDLIKKIDNDQNGICESYTIPTDDFIEITFKSKIPETSELPPSDIIIERYKVIYTPIKRNDILSFEEELYGNCLINAGETKTCRFPIFKGFSKDTFYFSYFYNGVTTYDDFNIKIVLYGKEILYDKSLKLTVNGTVGIGDFQQEDEALCSM